MITSKKILFNSNASSFEILKLQATTPPKALTGSHANADLKLLIFLFRIDTPQGFACLIMTVPLFFGRLSVTDRAEKMSL